MILFCKILDLEEISNQRGLCSNREVMRLQRLEAKGSFVQIRNKQ